MNKKIVYTNHALAALAERDLLPEWVERIVTSPAWIEVDPSGPDVQRRFGKVPERGLRYMRVACVETSTEIRILSAFLDRKARPR